MLFQEAKSVLETYCKGESKIFWKLIRIERKGVK